MREKKGYLQEITEKWVKQGVIKEEDRLIYQVGLDVILSTALQMGLIWTIGAVCFRDYYISIVFWICFATIREHGGGYHAPTRIRCIMTMIACYLSVIVTIRLFERAGISPACLIPLSGVDAFLMFKYAPVSNTAKLEQGDFLQKHRKCALLWWGIWKTLALFLLFSFHDAAMCILLAELLAAILMLPCTKEEGRKKHEKK